MNTSSTPEPVAAAVQRAGSSPATRKVAVDVDNVLRNGEQVMEFADTSAPGFPSALAVTDQRVLVGAGPGTLHFLELAAITGLALDGQSLVLRCLDQEVRFSGLAEKAGQRVAGAVAWALGQLDTPKTPGNSAEILDTYDAWADLMVSHQSGAVSDEDVNRALSELLSHREW